MNNASGVALLTHTRLDGRYVVRFAVGGVHTTLEDVRKAWEALEGAAR